MNSQYHEPLMPISNESGTYYSDSSKDGPPVRPGVIPAILFSILGTLCIVIGGALNVWTIFENTGGNEFKCGLLSLNYFDLEPITVDYEDGLKNKGMATLILLAVAGLFSLLVSVLLFLFEARQATLSQKATNSIMYWITGMSICCTVFTAATGILYLVGVHKELEEKFTPTCETKCRIQFGESFFLLATCFVFSITTSVLAVCIQLKHSTYNTIQQTIALIATALSVALIATSIGVDEWAVSAESGHFFEFGLREAMLRWDGGNTDSIEYKEELGTAAKIAFGIIVSSVIIQVFLLGGFAIAIWFREKLSDTMVAQLDAFLPGMSMFSMFVSFAGWSVWAAKVEPRIEYGITTGQPICGGECTEKEYGMSFYMAVVSTICLFVASAASFSTQIKRKGVSRVPHAVIAVSVIASLQMLFVSAVMNTWSTAIGISPGFPADAPDEYRKFLFGITDVHIVDAGMYESSFKNYNNDEASILNGGVGGLVCVILTVMAQILFSYVLVSVLQSEGGGFQRTKFEQILPYAAAVACTFAVLPWGIWIGYTEPLIRDNEESIIGLGYQYIGHYDVAYSTFFSIGSFAVMILSTVALILMDIKDSSVPHAIAAICVTLSLFLLIVGSVVNEWTVFENILVYTFGLRDVTVTGSGDAFSFDYGENVISPVMPNVTLSFVMITAILELIMSVLLSVLVFFYKNIEEQTREKIQKLLPFWSIFTFVCSLIAWAVWVFGVHDDILVHFEGHHDFFTPNMYLRLGWSALLFIVSFALLAIATLFICVSRIPSVEDLSLPAPRTPYFAATALALIGLVMMGTAVGIDSWTEYEANTNLSRTFYIGPDNPFYKTWENPPYATYDFALREYQVLNLLEPDATSPRENMPHRTGKRVEYNEDAMMLTSAKTVLAFIVFSLLSTAVLLCLLVTLTFFHSVTSEETRNKIEHSLPHLSVLTFMFSMIVWTVWIFKCQPNIQDFIEEYYGRDVGSVDMGDSTILVLCSFSMICLSTIAVFLGRMRVIE